MKWTTRAPIGHALPPPQASNISSIFGRHKHNRRSVPQPICRPTSNLSVNCGMVNFSTGIDCPIRPAHHDSARVSNPSTGQISPRICTQKTKPPLHCPEESDHTRIPGCQPWCCGWVGVVVLFYFAQRLRRRAWVDEMWCTIFMV